MTAMLFIIGLISIPGQVVLLRELNVASFGVELVYILGLGFWLLSTALGVLSGGSSRSPRTGILTAPLLSFAALLPLSVAFSRGSRVLLGGVPGAYLPPGEQVITIALTLLPTGFLAGYLFRRAAGFFVSGGRTLAAAYAIESAGGLAGGLLSTLGLYAGLQNLGLALVCSLIAGMAPLLIPYGIKRRRRRLPTVIVCGIVLLAFYQAPTLDGLMTRWNHPFLVESRDTPYGRVSVTELERQISVYINDALAFETEGTEADHFAHLAALQHPHPVRMLVLGGGIDGTAGELLKYGPEALDYVEVDPVLFRTVVDRLPPEKQAPFQHSAVMLVTDDPRRFLQAAAGRYDLILIGMPEPSSGQANRFYTREFFRLCRERLNPGGIVALRLQAAENRWTEPMTQRVLSIHGALHSVFGDVLIIPGDTIVVTAAAAALPRDPKILADRLVSRGIQSRLVSEPFVRYLLTNDRFGEIEETLRTRTAPPNTDARPVCYTLTVLLWVSKLFPNLTGLRFEEIETFVKDRQSWTAAAAALFLLIVFMARGNPSWKRILLVGIAGFSGMVLETVLILQYQTQQGVLFGDLGILITAFMLGSAAGAMALAGSARNTPRYSRIGRAWGICLVAGFILLGICAVLQTRFGWIAGLAETAGLLAFTGFLVAGIFAYASLRGSPEQEKVISPLYAADLFGGCLGSLAASLVMIPLFGMDVTAAGMAVLSFVAALLI